MTDTITTDLNPVPSRKSPSTFSSRMDTWLNKISTWTTEANALATGANANKLAAEAAETTAKEWAENPEDVEVEAGQYSAKHHAAKASSSETNAAASASKAESFAQSAINAPGTSATSTTSVLIGTGSKSLTIQTGKDIVVGMFVLIARTSAPTNYMAGQVTSYNSETGALVVFVDSVGGSGTYTDWTVSLSAITFDVATEAEMQAGTETAIRTMSPALVAALVDARPDYQEFTSSGTWTKPATAKYVYVEAVGGGGGGAANAGVNTAGGGGGGEFVSVLMAASTVGSTETITIGAGGNGGSAETTYNGAVGGITTFGSHLTAVGGNGGIFNNGYWATVPRSLNATTTTSSAPASVFPQAGMGGKAGDVGYGGNTIYGGAGGGGVGSSSYPGGASEFGGDGGNGGTNAPSTAGAVPGGGGGAANNGYAGSSGGSGRIRIWTW
jgi:hypothetical protein